MKLQFATLGRCLAAAGLAGMLAACSGQGQVPSTGSLVGAQSVDHATRTLSPMATSRLSNSPGPVPHSTMAQFLGRKYQESAHSFASSRKKCPKRAYIYANDNTTGDVDLYCEDAVAGATNTLLATCTGCGGWGLAVSPATQQLAIGTSAGTVTTWTINPATGIPVATGAVLQLASGDPLGICYDSSGGLYATDFPSNQIDYFGPGSVGTAGTWNPTGNWIMSTTQTGYYLACDFDKLYSSENILMVDGWDSSGNDVLSNVAVAGVPGPATPVADAIKWVYGPGSVAFPGGMTLNKHDNLVVSNQYGVLNDMGFKELWKNAPTATCKDQYDYTGIVFDDAQDEIWADAVSSSGATAVLSNKYPLNNNACVPGTSGTIAQPNPANGETLYLGVAVYPNRGV